MKKLTLFFWLTSLGLITLITFSPKISLADTEIQEATKFIRDDLTAGDCGLIGTWDYSTKICTLTTDLEESIRIDADFITLDCNYHTITGSGIGFGIYAAGKQGITVKNCKVSNFAGGIHLDDSFNNQILNNEVSSNTGHGICLDRSNNNIISGNSLSNNRYEGIIVIDSVANTLDSNSLVYENKGIYLRSSNNNIIINNTVFESKWFGIRLESSNNNKIYHNNFIENENQAGVYEGMNNLFDNEYPDGGNYWSDYTGLDLNNDGIGDTPYTFEGGQDNHPFMKENGWRRILPDKAVELAKEVVEAPYLGDGRTWGGKGEDCKVWDQLQKRFVSPTEIKEGYFYFDKRYETTPQQCRLGKGFDCSGLVFWSYNRAYFGAKLFTPGEYKNRPLYYTKASEQKVGNTNPIIKADLKPGDLLFFDAYLNDGIIDHVAVYIGGVLNNVIHPNLFTGTTTYATYNPNTEKVTTTKPTGEADPIKVVAYGRVTEPRIGVKFIATSPVDLIITDPEGLITIRENPWGYPMEYQIYDINDDGEFDDIVVTGERKIGDYLIQVVPEPDAPPTDTYTLTIEALVNGVTVTKNLAEEVLISDIPSQPYILRSTETGIEKIILAKVKIEPETLNLNQKGVFTAFIEFSKGFGVSVTEIDLQTVTIQGISAVRTSIAKDKFIAKFQTQDLTNVTPGEKVEFKIAGKLKDGTVFEGVDTIRVIQKGQILGLSSLLANLYETLSQLSKILQMLQ